MAGRVTFKKPGAPLAAASYVRPVPVSEQIWKEMERSFGSRRRFTESERRLVQESVEIQAEIVRSNRNDRPSSQDRKATLRALSILADADVARAYSLTDGFTQAVIAGAMHRAGVVDGRVLASPSGAQVKHFAAIALETTKPDKGGRRPSYTALAQAACALWQALGGKAYSASSKPGHATPYVRFAVAFFAAAGVHVTSSTVAKRLAAVR